MSQQPIISIIVPCYNSEKYLDDLMESFLNQTLKNFEVIFVNDGGSNIQKDKLDEYNKKYNFVKVVHKKNGGVSSARNMGITFAKGEWISFVDSDDIIKPFFLSSLYKAVNDIADCELVIGGFNYYYTRQKKLVFSSIKNIENNKIENILDQTNDNTFNSVCNKIYKRNIIEEYQIQFLPLTICEDACFNYEYLSHIEKLNYIQDCGYLYMMRDEGSAVSKYQQDLKQGNDLIKGYYKKCLFDFQYSEKEIIPKMHNLEYWFGYQSTINIFKVGNKDTFFQKYRFLKKYIFENKEFMEAYQKVEWNKNMLLKLFDVAIKTKSPLFTIIIYSIVFSFKYQLSIFYAKLKPQLRRSN